MSEKTAGLMGFLGRTAASRASRVGNLALQAWKKDKAGTVMGVGGLALLGPSMVRTTPEQVAGRQARRATARASASDLNAAFRENFAMTKSADVVRVLPGARKLYPQADLEKLAAAGAMRASVSPTNMFLLGAGLALGNQIIGATADAVEEGARRVGEGMRARSRAGRWKKVVAFDPDLGKLPHAKDAFDALDRASPYIAGEPMLAAAAVRQLADRGSAYEGGPPQVNLSTLKQVLDIQRGRLDTRGGPGGRTGRSSTAFSSLKADPSQFLGG